MKLSVSYLQSYYSKEKTVKLISNTSADYIHVDLRDGGFVPKRNFTVDEVLILHKNHTLPLDIHLMVFDPIIYIEELAKLKPDFITFHIEATKDIVKTIELIKRNNIKVGLAINLETNLLELMPYLSLIDLVLIMSIETGEGGRPFIPESANRIKEIKRIREENNLNFKIEVDGGVNIETIDLVRDVDIAVVGSYICKSTNFEDKIKSLNIK
ncbi:MAG: ribulose-phosphate 3-epimerase [Bacilli bacterium]|nr:ribulose-phosphate 3-epimerase [Bacilli bacterium]